MCFHPLTHLFSYAFPQHTLQLTVLVKLLFLCLSLSHFSFFTKPMLYQSVFGSHHFIKALLDLHIIKSHFTHLMRTLRSACTIHLISSLAHYPLLAPRTPCSLGFSPTYLTATFHVPLSAPSSSTELSPGSSSHLSSHYLPRQPYPFLLL